jgi:hypothetical protein
MAALWLKSLVIYRRKVAIATASAFSVLSATAFTLALLAAVAMRYRFRQGLRRRPS